MPGVHAYDRQRRCRCRHRCIETEERPRRSIASGAFSSQRRKVRWPKTAPLFYHTRCRQASTHSGAFPMRSRLPAVQYSPRPIGTHSPDSHPRRTWCTRQPSGTAPHATIAVGDPIRPVGRLGERDAPEFDCIVESPGHCIPPSPWSTRLYYLEAHCYFKFVENFFDLFKNIYVHACMHVG